MSDDIIVQRLRGYLDYGIIPAVLGYTVEAAAARIEALTAEVDVLEDDVLRFLQMRNAAVFAVQCALKYDDPKRMLSEWLIAGGFGTEVNHELLTGNTVEATDG